MSTKNQDEVFDLGMCLMEELTSNGILEEHQLNRFKAKERLLNEAAANPRWGEYNEGREGKNTHEIYHYHGKPIDWKRFYHVYTDYENFPTPTDIMAAIGFPPEAFNSHESMTKALNRIRKYFVKNNIEARQSGIGEVNTDKRKQAYYLQDDDQEDRPVASVDGINPGKRNRKTPSSKVIGMLNDQSVMPGEFYNDISRIKRNKWGNWIRFWEKQMSRIKDQRSLLGRVWQKTFIMGYQFDKRMFIEIWYNSATSSFSIYDQNGVEVGKPTETLQESIRFFVHHLVQHSEEDREVFQRDRAATQVAQSSLRALSRSLNQDVNAASREAELASIEARGGAPTSIRDAVAASTSQFKAWQDANTQKHDEAKAKRNSQNFTTDTWEMGTRRANAQAKERDDNLKAERDRKKKEAEDFKKKSEDDFVKRASDRFGQKINKSTIDGEATVVDDKQDRSLPHKKADPKAGNVEYDPFVGGKEGDLTPQQAEVLRRKYEDKKQEFEKQQEHLEQLKQEQREMKKNRKALGDRFDVLNRRNRSASAVVQKRKEITQDEMEKLEKQVKAQDKTPNSTGKNKRRSVNEAFEDSVFDLKDTKNAEAVSMASRELDQQAVSLRNMAKNSPFTTASISNAVMDDMITTYDQTRAGKQVRRPKNFLDKWFRGRKAPIVLPNEKAGIWDSIRMAMIGARYRADFVIGYSLRDEINVEIWYITEPSNGKMVSSFYVYDVTSAMVIRSNLPYYRNAVQVVMAKVGVI